MTRKLRPRKSQPNYAALDAGDPIEDEEAQVPEAGPSSRRTRKTTVAPRRLLDEDFDVDEVEDEGGDGESDFAPDVLDPSSGPVNSCSEDEDEEILVEDEEIESTVKIGKRKRATSSEKTTTPRRATRPQSAPPTAKTKPKAKRQQYVLPTPSVHHRHRAMPLHVRPGGLVERLTEKPTLFPTRNSLSASTSRRKKAATATGIGIKLTNGFTHSPKVTDRVNKAWGYNVGSGPIWELVEDRGWFKEAVTVKAGVRRNGSGDGDGDVNMSADWEEEQGNAESMASEARRRPRVYANVRVKDGWEVLHREAATPYLPSTAPSDGTSNPNASPSPSITCLLGPHDDQRSVEMGMFETRKMSEFIPESKSHIFNAGAPVWGLDWCPVHADDREAYDYKQYLAVAPYPSHAHSPEIGVKVMRPAKACVQIWSLGPSPSTGSGSGLAATSARMDGVEDREGMEGRVEEEEQEQDDDGDGDGGKEEDEDAGELQCEMVLCIDSGPAHELKWCPLPSHDSGLDGVERGPPRKLGLLAGSFEDGSWSVYVVPDPRDIKPLSHGRGDGDEDGPVFVKLPEPILRIQLEETNCWAFDWGNSEVVAVGTTNGVVAIYDVGRYVKSLSGSDAPTLTDILPMHYITVHQSAIRALAWIRAPPSKAGGEPNLGGDPTVLASGGYDGVECMTDVREGKGCVMNRTRDVINTMAFSPFGGGPVTIDHENIVKAYSASPSMLGRGHTLLEPGGPVWTVGASDLHPQLAVGAADGSCITTNTLRSTRRGGLVPFFIHKIYQLDYNRNTGVYRMLERFYPQETQDRPAPKVTPSSSQDRIKANASCIGAWPHEVGVHRVVWNAGNGLARAGLLASATAAGIVRVDNLWGRWIKDKVPYTSVAMIRRERDDEDGVEEEDEDDDIF